jgi:aryl-alcohol dehydrogenase-like predicted oxidoreductase
MSGLFMLPVRLGKSGLKVSRIILGCMSYGTPEWQGWVLKEAEGIAHIKAAYDLGINTFDTADVWGFSFLCRDDNLTYLVGLLQWRVGDHPRKGNQAAQSSPGRDRSDD